MANRRRAECAMCKKPIAFMVWARWDGGTEPPPANPYPNWDEAQDGFSMLASMTGKTTQQRVCADHIEHFESGWSRMSGLPPGSVVVGHVPCKPPPPLPKGHNIRPETHWDGSIRAQDSEWGVWVHCRTLTPESAIGRPVDVFVPPEMVMAMLDLFKRAAINQRRQSMAEAERKALDG